MDSKRRKPYLDLIFLFGFTQHQGPYQCCAVCGLRALVRVEMVIHYESLNISIRYTHMAVFLKEERRRKAYKLPFHPCPHGHLSECLGNASAGIKPHSEINTLIQQKKGMYILYLLVSPPSPSSGRPSSHSSPFSPSPCSSPSWPHSSKSSPKDIVPPSSACGIWTITSPQASHTKRS